MSQSDIAISIRGLSKSYNIAHQMRRPPTFREVIMERLRHPFRRQTNETFWALKDVSFDVPKGDVVGIIGRNGAGKSTLLKILSRITKPTAGEIDVYGRVGSLLEVGTGFHSELTGRENIYLNGAILGMRRAETRRQFDAIVDFSGIEQFLDTPVKRYSSGMYVRLAFAVAAHLNPEILVVDEVLAVGDAEFQKKCLNKMGEVATEGRTVLFVSHNMTTLARLCRSGVLLDSGEVMASGPAQEVLTKYLAAGLNICSQRTWNGRAPGDHIAKLVQLRICTRSGETTDSTAVNQPIGIEMIYDVLEGGHVLVPNLHFYNDEGIYLFVAQEMCDEWRNKPRPAGRYRTTAWVLPNLLNEGTVVVGAALTTFAPMIVHFYERDAVAFHVVEATQGESSRGEYHGKIPGAIRPLLEWTAETIDDGDADDIEEPAELSCP